MTIPFPVRVGFLVLICMLFIGGYLLLTPPLPQPQEYHQFADQRPMVGMPHALNVLSNLPFLIVGVWGMIWMARNPESRAFVQPTERWAYWIYFIGLALTALGSGWYHANPNNATLVWDRAALAITFMALFTAIVAERLCWQLSPWLVGPMVVLGVGSVLYWDATDDLRFYLVVQFFPLVALPMLFILFRPRYTRTGDMIASLLCYGLAKVVEHLDAVIYEKNGLVSGHTLKHLVAGGSAYFVLLMLQYRRATEPEKAVVTEEDWRYEPEA